jgi:hypothetical protein
MILTQICERLQGLDHFGMYWSAKALLSLQLPPHPHPHIHTL